MRQSFARGERSRHVALVTDHIVRFPIPEVRECFQTQVILGGKVIGNSRADEYRATVPVTFSFLVQVGNGVTCFVRVRAVGIVFPLRFPLPVSGVQVGFHFAAIVVYIGAGIIAALCIGSGLYASVIACFPVFF